MAPAWLAGVAAILPLAMINAAPAVEAATAPAAFVPPGSTLLLTRTLHSPLADGREIVSRRTYEVTITADGAGWRVDGRLVDSSVSAPRQLAFLAELERNRTDDGMFPIRLDSRGMILAGGEALSGEAREKAAAAAVESVKDKPAEAPDRQVAVGLFEQLRRQPVMTAWPSDLFHPAPGRRTDTRVISLPDGTRGEVTIEVEARPAKVAPAAPAVSSLHRVITTRMGASARTLREEWTLAMAPDLP